VSTGNLTNATAIGNGATVNASNKIRLGNTSVTVIEGQVALTFPSDKTQKENFQPVDGEEVLGKIRGFELSSWNFIGHDPKKFRHYGPMAQDFFAAFGHDGLGQIGSETTINSGDLAGILMIAVQALEKRTAELKQKEAQVAVLESKVEELNAKQNYFETVAARVEALELRKNHSIQITAEKSLGDKMVDVMP
jgi:Chaperone of endosialidase